MTETDAREAMRLAAAKLSIKTRFVKRFAQERRHEERRIP